jgi:hypothetical protein
MFRYDLLRELEGVAVPNAAASFGRYAHVLHWR